MENSNLTASEQHELLRKQLFANAFCASLSGNQKYHEMYAAQVLKAFDEKFPAPTNK